MLVLMILARASATYAKHLVVNNCSKLAVCMHGCFYTSSLNVCCAVYLADLTCTAMQGQHLHLAMSKLYANSYVTACRRVLQANGITYLIWAECIVTQECVRLKLFVCHSPCSRFPGAGQAPAVNGYLRVYCGIILQLLLLYAFVDVAACALLGCLRTLWSCTGFC